MTSLDYIYGDMILELRQACQEHCENQLSADELQRIVQRAEATVLAVDEKDVRSKMTDTEGQLELIKFTVEEDQQYGETRKIAEGLLAWLANREHGTGAT